MQNRSSGRDLICIYRARAGGARVITYLVTDDNEVYLTYIYDKSQLENISKEQIMELLKKAGLVK